MEVLFKLYKAAKNKKSSGSEWLKANKELLASIKANHNGVSVIYNENGTSSFVYRGRAYYA